MSAIGYKPHPQYTKENHPFRNLIFTGYAPGMIEFRGKPWLPDSWIITFEGEGPARGQFAMQNSKQDCERLAGAWGAEINWLANSKEEKR